MVKVMSKLRQGQVKLMSKSCQGRSRSNLGQVRVESRSCKGHINVTTRSCQVQVEKLKSHIMSSQGYILVMFKVKSRSGQGHVKFRS